MSDDRFLYMDDTYDYNISSGEEDGSGGGGGGGGGRMVLPALYYTVFCLGLLGNATVLWILLRHIKLRSMTDVCLLNLALCDLIVAVSLPLYAYNSQNLLSCKLMTGIYQLGFYGGNFFVTLMSVDRYLAIVCAVEAMQTRTLRYGILVSFGIWVVSAVMATPQVIFASIDGEVEDNGSLWCQRLYPEDAVQSWKLQRNFTENAVSLFLCLPIMVFCYVKILFVISRLRNSQKGRAVKLIFAIVCVFLVCWVPYNIVVFLKTLQLFHIMNNQRALSAINTAMSFSEIILLTHCCVNPVIYAFVGDKFRKSLRKVLRRSLCWSSQSTASFRDTTEKETSNTAVRSDHCG